MQYWPWVAKPPDGGNDQDDRLSDTAVSILISVDNPHRSNGEGLVVHPRLT